MNKSILNRYQITFKDAETELAVHKAFCDWAELIKIQEQMNLIPYKTILDIVPNIEFHNLRTAEDNNENPLQLHLICDTWENLIQ